MDLGLTTAPVELTDASLMEVQRDIESPSSATVGRDRVANTRERSATAAERLTMFNSQGTLTSLHEMITEANAVLPAAPVSLTVDHLCYSYRKHSEEMALKNITFALKPGDRLLVVGGPGSGKSTLLRALSAKLPPHGKMKGTLLVNGEKPSNYTAYNSLIASMPQEDIHFPDLTVKQTLDFAIGCKFRAVTPEEKGFASVRTANFLRALRLEHAKDTLVGNDMLRGVSGGEKRRVTMGTSFAGEPRLAMLDEPTTGLDSAAALAVMEVCCEVSKSRFTTIAALLQPSQEIFDLFTHVLVLSEGHMVYFGERETVGSYFRSLGYERPQFKNEPDFISEVAALIGHSFYHGPDIPHSSAQDLARAFKQSSYYRHVQEQIEEEVNTSDGGYFFADSEDVGNYTTSRLRQTWLCTKRVYQTRYNNPQASLVRFVKAILVGLVVGTVFLAYGYDPDQTGASLIPGCLFFISMFVGFGQMPVATEMFLRRPVYYHQKAHKYYASLPYYVSVILGDLPLIFMEAVVFSTIAYFLFGFSLADGGARYLYFLLAIFVLSFSMFGLIVCGAALFPTEEISMAVLPIGLFTLILYSGFLIVKDQAPRWVFWITYLSPFYYLQGGLAMNELIDRDFDCEDDELVPYEDDDDLYKSYHDGGFEGNQICPLTTGEQMLDALDLETEWLWAWAFLLILCGFGAVFLILGYLATRFIVHTPKRPATPLDSVPPQVFDLLDSKDESAKKTSTLVFKDVCYTVNGQKRRLFGKANPGKQLLTDIYGHVEPGQMCALMGPSGAGKTTLLDVLAMRKNVGTTSGEILYRGRKQDRRVRKLIGYVEQQSIHFQNTTVHQAIEFSANCRLGKSFTEKEKEKRVWVVLSQVELLEKRNWPLDQLSVEELKRVTIGVELAADPEILFLDEPTSGLDAVAAYHIMAMVKRLTETENLAVICTIHQPSARVFSLFTDLLLMRPGGKMVYFGPIGEEFQDVLSFFEEAHEETCGSMENPADFLLDRATPFNPNSHPDFVNGNEQKKRGIGFRLKSRLLKAFRKNDRGVRPMEDEDSEDERNGIVESEEESSSREAPDRDPAEIWEAHPLSEKAKRDVDEMIMAEREVAESSKIPGAKYAQPFHVQVKELLRRRIHGYELQPAMLFGPFIFIGFLVAALLVTFPRLDDSQQGVTQQQAALYYFLLLPAMLVFGTMTDVMKNRAAFYRERSSSTYSSIAYIVHFFIFTILPVVFLAFLTGTAFYWIIGLRSADGPYYYFFFIIALTVAYISFVSFGTLVAIASPDAIIASGLISAVLSLNALFSGFLVPWQAIRPWWWFAYWLCFLHYSTESVWINQYAGNNDLFCDDDEYIPIPVPDMNVNMTNLALTGQLSPEGLPPIRVQNWCRYDQGDSVLENRDFFTESWVKWLDLGVLVGCIAVFWIGATICLKYLKHMKR